MEDSFVEEYLDNWNKSISKEYHVDFNIACLCLYEDRINGVIYIDATSDSLKWMFRGDLSNFPQIQFLVRNILRLDSNFVPDIVTRAAISILSVLSDENQRRVIDHISLVRVVEDVNDVDYLTQYQGILKNTTESFNDYVIRQWIAFNIDMNPDFDPSEEECKSFDTSLIRKSIDGIINRITETTYIDTDKVGRKVITEFFIDASKNTGFAKLELKKLVPDLSEKSKVLYCLIMIS